MPQIQQVEPQKPATIQKTPDPVGTTGGNKTTDPMTAVRSSLFTQMNEIQVTKDPLQKLDLLSGLEQSSRQYLAGTKKEITERNVAESRIPELQAKIKEEDKGGAGAFLGNVINARFGLPNTANQLRLALHEEIAQVEKKINREFEGNPDVAAVAALHDKHGFLAVHSALATTAINRAENDAVRDVNREDLTTTRREDAKTRTNELRLSGEIQRQGNLGNQQSMFQMQQNQKKIDQEIEQERKEAELHAAITPSQRDVARVYGQKVSGDPSTDKFLIQNIKINKPFQDVIAAADSPEMMVTLALNGNPAAAAVAIGKQAELVSGTEDRLSPKYRAAHAAATGDMRAMNKIMTSPDAYDKALTSVYGAKGSPMRKKYEATLANETALLSAKDRLTVTNQKRAEVAKEALAMANKDRFMGSINSWPDQTLAFVQASPLFTKLAQDKGKDNVSVEDMTRSIMAIVDPAERQKQMGAFKDTMQQAANIQNQAYFGFAIDNLAVDIALDKQIERTLLGDLGDPVGAGIGALRSILTNVLPVKSIQDAYNALESNTDLIRYIKGK